MGKESFFQQIMLRKLDIHMQKNEFRPLLHIIYKINLKWSTDLNARAKIRKILEENIRVNLFDIGLGKAFLNMTLNAKITTEKK